jgi:hypothetical protein
MRIRKDMTGIKFGKLTIINQVEKPETAKTKGAYWLCCVYVNVEIIKKHLVYL